MRPFILGLVLFWVAVVSASRTPVDVHLGRSLQQQYPPYTCAVATGCTRCPDGCMDKPSSCWGDTGGRWRCKKCQDLDPFPVNPKENLRPAADGSCGCIRGWYLVTAPTRRCVQCPANHYCPGGTETASSVIEDCPDNMVTNNLGSFSMLFCVNGPGFSYNAPLPTGVPSASQCPENTFCTGRKRQAKCTPCPSGMKTAGGLPALTFSTTTLVGYATTFNTPKTTPGAVQQISAAACKVPPGWYVTSTNKVIRCPRAEYRQDYVDATDNAAHKCLRCPRGTTTNAAASPEFKFCDVLVPGYWWIDPAVRPGVGTPPAGGEYTKICEQNAYCPGGYPTDTLDATGPALDGKLLCPNDLWTRNIGTTAAADCLIPPGHRLTSTVLADATVIRCSNDPGQYSPDWRKPFDTLGSIIPEATTCKACGSGILSYDVEPLSQYTLDSTGFAAPDPASVNVPQTSASCYIQKGQGTMLASGSTMTDPVYRAINCVGNNYGVADKQYELRLSPCKDCPTNTFTDAVSGLCYTTSQSYYSMTKGKGGFFDPRACCTKPGWGFDGVRAAVCAQGSYNTANEEPADKCKDCPPGTTTLHQPPTGPQHAVNVDQIEDCKYTLPGFGQQSLTDTAGNPDGLKECPVGTYGKGDVLITVTSGDLNAPCITCPNGKTTRFAGAALETDCDVCPAGKGATNSETPGTACTNCLPNYFGDISRAGGDYKCKPCPGSAASSFSFHIDDGINTINVNPVSEAGAVSAQQCLLEFAAFETGNWYLPATSLLPIEAATNAASCLLACNSVDHPTCQFFTFDYGTKNSLTQTCGLKVADSASGEIKIAYKVLAGNGLGDETRRRTLLGGAKPKEAGSGVFSWFDDDTAHTTGVDITDVVLSTYTISKCLQFCNDESTCAAVVFKMTAANHNTLVPGAEACTFKRGVVTLPTSTDYSKRTMVRYRTNPGTARPNAL